MLQAGDNNHFHPTCARCTKCGDPFGDGEEMYLQVDRDRGGGVDEDAGDMRSTEIIGPMVELVLKVLLTCHDIHYLRQSCINVLYILLQNIH